MMLKMRVEQCSASRMHGPLCLPTGCCCYTQRRISAIPASLIHPLQELARLLQEERLAGATLLIMANKQDVPGALGADAIREVGEGGWDRR